MRTAMLPPRPQLRDLRALLLKMKQPLRFLVLTTHFQSRHSKAPRFPSSCSSCPSWLRSPSLRPELRKRRRRLAPAGAMPLTNLALVRLKAGHQRIPIGNCFPAPPVSRLQPISILELERLKAGHQRIPIRNLELERLKAGHQRIPITNCFPAAPLSRLSPITL